jgi:hypothetical protein
VQVEIQRGDENEPETLVLLDEAPAAFDLRDLVEGQRQAVARGNLREMWEIYIFPCLTDGFIFGAMDNVAMNRFTSVYVMLGFWWFVCLFKSTDCCEYTGHGAIVHYVVLCRSGGGPG